MNKKIVFIAIAFLSLLTTIYIIYQPILKYYSETKLNLIHIATEKVFTQNESLNEEGTTIEIVRAISERATNITGSNTIIIESVTSATTTTKIKSTISIIESTTVKITTEAPESCPNGTILWTFDWGNTGNKVWEYLSVLAVYKLFPEKRFFPYIPDNMIKSLEKIFEPLSLPAMSTLPAKCRNFKGARIIRFNEMYPVIAKLPNNTKVVQLATYSARHEEVIRYGLDKVRREFRYKPASVKIAMDTLYELRRKFSIPFDANPVYVGMQFRGTDYTNYLRNHYKKRFRGAPTHEFYSRAMKYFTDKYKHVIFILISIDYKWIAKNAKQLKGNVAVNPYKGNKVEDMALLSHCNHSIINYGTFGTTVAMLAGGTTIVYDLKVDLDHDGRTIAMAFTKLVDNWILMD